MALLTNLLEDQCKDVIILHKKYERLSSLNCEKEAIRQDLNRSSNNINGDRQKTFQETDREPIELASSGKDLKKHSKTPTQIDAFANLTVQTLKRLSPGDCIVCFSRVQIFRLKQ